MVAETGLPAGVINIVTGKGSVIGNEMAGSPKIDIVSVTGSVSAGESIMAAASKNITKVSLELGGKAPAIVCKDADLSVPHNGLWTPASATMVRYVTMQSVYTCRKR